MNGAQVIDFFENIIEDSIDGDTAYVLMNNAKNKVEEERDWEMLKKLQTASAGSSAIALPADYRTTLQIYVNNQTYSQIPFEQKNLFANSALRWYLDFANSNIYLLGSNITGTFNHFYKKTTDDIDEDSSPVWPTRFHPLLAFEMAELYFAIDQGDRPRSWDDKWNTQKQLLRLAMVDWDTQLKRRANENAMPPDSEPEYDLSQM